MTRDAENPIERGSGNVFADLELPDADERMAKAFLSRLIHEDIEHRGLNQSEAARILGCAQPDVSNVVRGNVSGFSLERLTRFLLALGHDVAITVRPAGDAEPGRLLVHA
jgi:predicted XRE-type DNA-binding protein